MKFGRVFVVPNIGVFILGDGQRTQMSLLDHMGPKWMFGGPDMYNATNNYGVCVVQVKKMLYGNNIF